MHDLIAADEDLCITGIILTEILQGIRDDKSNSETREYLLDYPVYDPTGAATCIEAANVYRRCLKKGKTVRRTIDCLIAAVALENDIMIPISIRSRPVRRLKWRSFMTGKVTFDALCNMRVPGT